MKRFFTFLIGGLLSCNAAIGQCVGTEPGASAFGGVLTCSNQSVTLQGNSPTPNVIFSWIGPNGYFSDEQNPEISETGVYFLEVRNPDNGCVSVAYVVIVSNYDEPDVSAVGGVIPCSGSAVQLTGHSETPLAEFAWSGPEGFTSIVQNPVVSIPGNYFLTVTNPLTGCEAIEIVAVEYIGETCVFVPVAIHDLNITLREISVSGSLLTNDFHPQGNDLFTEGFRRHSDDGPFLPSVTIQGQGTFTLTDPGTGGYSFQPFSEFTGSTDPVEYVVCDVETGQCATAMLSVEVIDDKLSNNTPVALNDNYHTALGTEVSGVFLSNDFDPDGDQLSVNMMASSGVSGNGGSWVLNPDNTFIYTPSPGFTGLDSLFVYEICDGVSGCDQGIVTVRVVDPGAENSFFPSGSDDASMTRQDFEIAGNLLNNDLNGQGAEILTLTLVNGEEVQPGGLIVPTEKGGTAILFQDGSFNYFPASGYTGGDRLEYTVCNEGNFCDNATIYFLIMPPSCININMWVYLEGPYLENEGKMSADLNVVRSVLPGQEPANPAFEDTPAGNPYRGEPWNYNGSITEESYSGPYINSDGKAVTDWILLSFRSGINPGDEIAKANGLLYEDGSVGFIEPCVLRTSDPQNLWIVIEHRNHMGVMSDSAVVVQNGKLEYDFRQTDSYHLESSFGQKEILPGVWAMYTGDVDQNDAPSFDINGTDNIIWMIENGNFSKYLLGDFDLNGDINGADNILYNENNGISSSVPKE